MTPRDLITRWRQEAELFERRGLPDAARAARNYATELETALTEWELEGLTVKAAAMESGYDESSLRRLFPGQKQIARKDLPKKARSRNGPDLAGEILRAS